MNYFSEKTSISTPNGYRNLSDLKKGDQIWTWSGTAFKSTKIKNFINTTKQMTKKNVEQSYIFECKCPAPKALLALIQHNCKPQHH